MPALVDSLHTLALEATSPKVRRRGRSRYMRKALIYMGAKSPAEFDAHQPRDMWEKIAKNMLTQLANGKGPTVVTGYATIRDTLGEKISTDGISRYESTEKPNVTVVNDAVPFAIRTN